MPVIIVPAGVEKRHRIAYSNLLRDPDAVVTVSGEADGYEKELAYDWREYDAWKNDAPGAAWMQCVLPVAQLVNYFAWHGTDLHVNGGNIRLQYSDDAGANWTDVVGTDVDPTHGGPYYLCFDPILSDYWRVLIDSTPESEISVLSFGVDFVFERGMWAGLTPPELAWDDDITNTTSENGAHLGRTIERRKWSGAMKLEWVTMEWIYGTWAPFIAHARRWPFFYLWDKPGHPLSAAFAWTTGKIEKPAIKKGGMSFMSAGLKYECKTIDP